jgi:MFS transporter, DHA1 family, tetracycline resistance protein
MGQYLLTTQATMQIWMDSYAGDFAGLARAQGLCASLGSLINFVVGPAGGALSDAMGRKPMMFVGPVADLVQRLITLPLMDAKSEAVARVLFGSLAGATSQSHATALADMYSNDPVTLGIWQSRLAMGATLLTMLLPVASSALSVRNLRLPLLISAVLCVCNMLLISTTVTETLSCDRRKAWTWSSSSPLSMLKLFCKVTLSLSLSLSRLSLSLSLASL